MKPLTMLVLIFVVAAIVGTSIVLLVKMWVFKQDVKAELGVFPNEFESKIYNVLLDKVTKVLTFDLSENFSTISDKDFPEIKGDTAKMLAGTWATEWAIGIAKKEGIDEKEFGTLSNGQFWITDSKYPLYKKAAADNAKYTIETKGIELKNEFTKALVKTTLETDFGINLDNQYFQKLFNKYNKR